MTIGQKIKLMLYDKKIRVDELNTDNYYKQRIREIAEEKGGEVTVSELNKISELIGVQFSDWFGNLKLNSDSDKVLWCEPDPTKMEETEVIE